MPDILSITTSYLSTLTSHSLSLFYHLFDIFALIYQDPIFRTRYNGLNCALTTLFYLVLGICVVDVFYIFRQAWRMSKKTSARSEITTLFGRPILKSRYLALCAVGFALVSLLSVNTLRYHHREMKVAAYKSIELWREAQYAASQETDLSSYVPDATGVKKKFYEYAYGKLPETLVDRIPWLPVDWNWNAGPWEYFRLLVDDQRRNWWTRQWYMGYLAWALFVSLECTARDIEGHAPAFLMLGYCFSLSSVQILTYAIFHLWPRSNPNQIWSPSVKSTSFTAAFQVLVLILVSVEIHMIPNGSGGNSWQDHVFNSLQLMLVLIPFLYILNDSGAWYESFNVAKKQLSRTWFVMSVCSTAFYAYSSYHAYLEANPDGWLFGRNSRWWGQLSWFIPWRLEKTHVGHASTYLMRLLGDHAWINALGWDVIFSLVGLLFWSVYGSANVRTMLQCSVCPWMEDVNIIGGKVLGQLSEGLEEAVETVEENTEGLRTATRRGMKQLKGAADRLREEIPEELRRRGVSRYLPDTSSSFSDEQSLRSPRSTRSRSRSRSTRQSTKSTKSRDSRRNARRSSGRDTDSDDGHSQSVWSSFTAWTTGWWSQSKGSAEQGSSLGDSTFTASEAEAAALTYVLWIVGGLGTASAAVFGADEI